MDNQSAADLQLGPLRLIDDALAVELAERGAQDAKRQQPVRFFIWSVVVVAGILSWILNVQVPALMGVPIVQIALLILFFGIYIATTETIKVKQAFSRGQFELASVLCPKAIIFNELFLPATSKQMNDCFHVQLQLLALEERYLEYEALIRYFWAATEGRAVTTGIPRQPGITSNLAFAWLGQMRYQEAATLLAELVKGKLDPHMRLIMLTQLTEALLKSNQEEAAEQVLAEASLLVGDNHQSRFGWQLLLLRAILEIQREHFDAAEQLIENVRSICVSLSEPLATQAVCDEHLAEIKFKQQRYEHAEKYYVSAITAYQTAKAPLQLTLIMCLRDYANMLQSAGREDAAQQPLNQAMHLQAIYAEREVQAIEAIRRRLADRRIIWAAADLLQKKVFLIRADSNSAY